MSANRNRAKLSKAETGREYRVIHMHDEWDGCYICARRHGSFYYSCSPASMRAYWHGSGRPIYSHTYRGYKTWKHNRRTR